jgi:hypothetical protein
MATSGTVGQTRVSTQKVIDHAFRRARIPPQKITREHIHVAKDLLFLILSGWANKGIALWAIQTHLLPMYDGKQTVPTPAGTVDALNANIRQLTRFSGIATSSEGNADLAFDGDIETACTQVTAGGWIALEIETALPLTNFGILPAATGTWTFDIQISDDGVSWSTVDTQTAIDMVAGEWYWWDVEGIPDTAFMRILADSISLTILDIDELVFANNPLEIPLAKLNRDDYMNMPNKTFQSRPVQYWYNKQVSIPNMVLWPTPAAEFTFWQIALTTQRLIQDVGTVTQELELPPGGFLAIIASLAWYVAQEIDDAKVSPDALKPAMQEALTDFWAGQTDSSPTRLAFNIGPYTK